MRRKSIIMFVTLAAAALTACQPISVNINIPATSTSEEISEDSSSEEVSESDVSEEPVVSAEPDTSSSNIDGEIIEKLEQFVSSNFINYAGLAYTYPEYIFTTFDDNAKCKLICFTELSRENPQIDYSSEWELMEIKKDHVLELSKELFDCEVNTYSCQDVMTNHADVVKSDDDGNLLFNAGDWGTSYPIPADINIEGSDGNYTVKVDVAMFDSMEASRGDVIGTYTVNVATRDDGSFYVTDFKLQ